MTDFTTLEEFAAVDEPGAEPLGCDNDGGVAIPAGGLVVAYGNGGAGKTTLLIDCVFHLAAGTEWLSVKPTRQLSVLWIENEGPRPEFRKKLRAKLEAWEGPSILHRIHVLEDPWGGFSFRDELQREHLVQRLTDMEADLLVAGPVKAIGMQGGGTDDDIGDFLACVDDVRRRTGAAVALIHHENRQGQISGAWESRPDTLIHVQAQGHGRTRLFWQKVRWSSALHGTSASLIWADGFGFLAEDRPEINDESIADEILSAVRENAGASWSKIRVHVRGNATETARVRDRLLAGDKLVNTNAREGYFSLWVPEDPSLPRSGPGTGLERLSAGAPGEAAEAEPFRRSPYKGNGYGNGTAHGTGVEPLILEPLFASTSEDAG